MRGSLSLSLYLLSLGVSKRERERERERERKRETVCRELNALPMAFILTYVAKEREKKVS